MSENPLVIIGPNETDWYYTGRLINGISLYLKDDPAPTIEPRTPDGDGWILKSDNHWGTGDTFEDAWRYLLGAAFGPVDEWYDEDHLRTVLGLVESE